MEGTTKVRDVRGGKNESTDKQTRAYRLARPELIVRLKGHSEIGGQIFLLLSKLFLTYLLLYLLHFTHSVLTCVLSLREVGGGWRGFLLFIPLLHHNTSTTPVWEVQS